MNCDGDRTGTGVETNEGAQDGNGVGTGTGVETHGRTQDGNRDRNESSSRDGTTHTHTHGICTRASYRGSNRVRGAGRSEPGRGRDRSRRRERRR